MAAEKETQSERIARAFKEGTPIDKAVARAVRRAIADDKRARTVKRPRRKPA